MPITAFACKGSNIPDMLNLLLGNNKTSDSLGGVYQSYITLKTLFVDIFVLTYLRTPRAGILCIHFLAA